MADARKKKRFVSPCPLPSPYERELLTILIEECAEVQQRATKLLRFGADEIQSGQPLNNAERMAEEIGDVETMVDMICDTRPALRAVIAARKPIKRAKVLRYLQSEPRP